MAIVTKTLKSSGGDYSLMSTWESTEQTDLVTDGDSHVLECYDDWASGLDDYGVLISGWTTGASNTITIRPADGNGHSGVEGGGFYLSTTASNFPYYTLSVQQDHVTVEEIEIQHTGTYGTFLVSGADGVTLDKLILVRDAGASNADGASLQIGNNTDNFTLKNSVLKSTATDGSGVGISLDPRNGSDCYIYNNTLIMAGTGQLLDNSLNDNGFAFNLTFKNNVMYGDTCLDADAFSSYPNSDYNAFKSGISADFGTNKVTGITSADFADYANGDYRPAKHGALDGAGTDLSGTFTDDIQGATRE